jgi:hypothetical protein
VSFRVAIWILVVGAAIAAFVALQHLHKRDMEIEGRVTFHNKSGDLIAFFTKELQHYGATLNITNAVPPISAKWKYAEDPKGFQILVTRAKKDELLQALSRVLGAPMLREQYPHLVYKEDRFGVGVVADLQADPMHIICLRRGALF